MLPDDLAEGGLAEVEPVLTGVDGEEGHAAFADLADGEDGGRAGFGGVRQHFGHGVEGSVFELEYLGRGHAADEDLPVLAEGERPHGGAVKDSVAVPEGLDALGDRVVGDVRGPQVVFALEGGGGDFGELVIVVDDGGPLDLRVVLFEPGVGVLVEGILREDGLAHVEDAAAGLDEALQQGPVSGGADVDVGAVDAVDRGEVGDHDDMELLEPLPGELVGVKVFIGKADTDALFFEYGGVRGRAAGHGVGLPVQLEDVDRRLGAERQGRSHQQPASQQTCTHRRSLRWGDC